jgi:hypothetical protein
LRALRVFGWLPCFFLLTRNVSKVEVNSETEN